MTMLVEHGLIGAAVYVAIVLWMIRNLRALWRRVCGTDGFFAVLVPTVAAAILGCVTVGDMFVGYVNRLWFIDSPNAAGCTRMMDERKGKAITVTLIRHGQRIEKVVQQLNN
ncbi:MAG: hypothetical protein ACRED0_09470 [Gammaproteobacteria bacterium]